MTQIHYMSSPRWGHAMAPLAMLRAPTLGERWTTALDRMDLGLRIAWREFQGNPERIANGYLWRGLSHADGQRYEAAVRDLERAGEPELVIHYLLERAEQAFLAVMRDRHLPMQTGTFGRLHNALDALTQTRPRFAPHLHGEREYVLWQEIIQWLVNEGARRNNVVYFACARQILEAYEQARPHFARPVDADADAAELIVEDVVDTWLLQIYVYTQLGYENLAMQVQRRAGDYLLAQGEIVTCVADVYHELILRYPWGDMPFADPELHRLHREMWEQEVARRDDPESRHRIAWHVREALEVEAECWRDRATDHKRAGLRHVHGEELGYAGAAYERLAETWMALSQHYQDPAEMREARKEATDAYQSAALMQLLNANLSEAIRVTTRMGDVMAQADDVSLAIHAYRSAAEVYLMSGLRGKGADIFLRASDALRERGLSTLDEGFPGDASRLFQSALELCHEARAMYEAIGDQAGVSWAAGRSGLMLADRGSIAGERSQPLKAGGALVGAADMHTAIGVLLGKETPTHPRHEAAPVLSEPQDALGDALSLLEAAAQYYADAGASLESAHLQLRRGVTATLVGGDEVVTAHEAFEMAWKIAQTVYRDASAEPQDRVEARLLAGHAASRLGRDADAIHEYAHAITAATWNKQADRAGVAMLLRRCAEARQHMQTTARSRAGENASPLDETMTLEAVVTMMRRMRGEEDEIFATLQMERIWTELADTLFTIGDFPTAATLYAQLANETMTGISGNDASSHDAAWQLVALDTRVTARRYLERAVEAYQWSEVAARLRCNAEAQVAFRAARYAAQSRLAELLSQLGHHGDAMMLCTQIYVEIGEAVEHMDLRASIDRLRATIAGRAVADVPLHWQTMPMFRSRCSRRGVGDTIGLFVSNPLQHRDARNELGLQIFATIIAALQGRVENFENLAAFVGVPRHTLEEALHDPRHIAYRTLVHILGEGRLLQQLQTLAQERRRTLSPGDPTPLSARDGLYDEFHTAVPGT